MHLPPDSYFNCLLYQIGALVGFLKLEGLPLSHIKPHGQAYVMAARDVDLARQIAKLAKMYGVPMLGMPATAHQEACELEGAEFIPEWCVLHPLDLRRCRASLSRCSSGALTLVSLSRRYVDVLYSDEGNLLAPRSAALRDPVTPDDVYKRVRRALFPSCCCSSADLQPLARRLAASSRRAPGRPSRA